MGSRKITLKTIKNREAIHPYSRKAHQLTRVYQRKEKLAKQEKQRSSNPIGERWLWFRYAFEEENPTATKEEMRELVEIYLARHDDEISELEKDRMKAHKKPKTSHQIQLEATIEQETREYKSGMELPDMTNGKTLKLLREWDGDKNSMLRMTKISIQKPITPESEKVDKKNVKANGDMMEL